MTSRERIKATINHKNPDMLPIDAGSSINTGIHASNVYKLRQYYGLDKPGTPIKIHKVFVMTGVIEDDLRDIIGSDCCVPEDDVNHFGVPNEDYKEWKLNDGTPVLVPKLFNTEMNLDGSLYQYPDGNKKWSPCALMPRGGYFFDPIIRKKNVEDEKLDPLDNVEEYKIMDDNFFNNIFNKVKNLYNNTNYSIYYELPDTSFGDIATIPGTGLSNPKGIRDFEEWYISLYTRKEHIKKIFAAQLEKGMENLKKLANKLGDMLDFVIVTSTDFGAQTNLFIPVDLYRELFKPYHKKINNYIHSNTNWKTFIHSCGAIYDLIPDLIDAGFDILNPVQISAKGMDPKKLKKEYGKDIVFLGGATNTQKTLHFGSPKEVKEETRKLIDIFLPEGGFIASSVHIIQGNVPLENIVALIDTYNEYRN